MKFLIGLAIFVIGFVFGLAIDTIPMIFSNIANVTLCAEGCARWKKELIFPITIGMPFLWGSLALFLARRRNQKKTMVGLFSFFVAASLAVMFALIWITK